MSVYTNGIIHDFIERKEETRSAEVLRHARQRVASVAHELSRKGAMAASAELCNEAVCKLIELVYETDETGYCNIDVADNKILIPLPWGRSGHRKYGLRSTMGNVLRLYLYRVQDARHVTQLFMWDSTIRFWLLNRWDYPTREDALKMWNEWGMTPKLYSALDKELRRDK